MRQSQATLNEEASEGESEESAEDLGEEEPLDAEEDEKNDGEEEDEEDKVDSNSGVMMTTTSKDRGHLRMGTP